VKQTQPIVVQDKRLQVVLNNDRWDVFTFVDCCEKALRQDPTLEKQFRNIQQIEWQLLFDHCYRKAIE